MVVYLGVVPTALAFTTWAYALTRTSAGKMGATTYVVPAIVVLMSWRSSARPRGRWPTWAGRCAWAAWRSPGATPGWRHRRHRRASRLG